MGPGATRAGPLFVGRRRAPHRPKGCAPPLAAAGAPPLAWEAVAKNVLLYGDCERSAAMRHEVPVGVGDAFMLAEIGGRTYVMVNRLESERIARARPDAELIDIEALGLYELAPHSDGWESLWLQLT